MLKAHKIETTASNPDFVMRPENENIPESKVSSHLSTTTLPCGTHIQVKNYLVIVTLFPLAVFFFRCLLCSNNLVSGVI